MNKTWMFIFLLSTIVMSSSSEAQDNNPFKYKPKKPETTEYQRIPPPDPNLSDIQKKEVAGMIKDTAEKLLREMSKLEKGSRSVTLTDGEYIVLKEKEIFSGISSGMFVVFNESTQEYEYFDSQKYKDVISASEHNEIVAESEKNAFSKLKIKSQGSKSRSSSEETPKEPQTTDDRNNVRKAKLN